MGRHDGPLCGRRGFRREELEELGAWRDSPSTWWIDGGRFDSWRRLSGKGAAAKRRGSTPYYRDRRDRRCRSEQLQLPIPGPAEMFGSELAVVSVKTVFAPGEVEEIGDEI